MQNLLLLTLMSFTGFGNSVCECPPPVSVSIAVTNSAAVFSGEVIGEEYENLEKDGSRTLVIKLKVMRWWKGSGAAEIDLYTSGRKYANGNTTFMADDFRFLKGESYLVYATLKEEKFSTSACTRTQKLADAADDLRELGEGLPPKPRSGDLRQSDQ
jgi:hypothetical protein